MRTEKVDEFYAKPVNLPSPLNCSDSSSMPRKLTVRCVWLLVLYGATLTNMIFSSGALEMTFHTSVIRI